MYLLILSIAPIFIIALYIYFRDKYEKEPIKLIVLALVAGMLIVIPIIYLEEYLSYFGRYLQHYSLAFYTSFVVAAFSEESFKFLAFIVLFWTNKNFNEKFDGIVYAVFISLGFALVENIMYVFQNGAQVGYLRALTAVPAHALFGISMGFHFGIAKFFIKRCSIQIGFALTVPIILHGIYDFILFSQHKAYMFLFVIYVVYLWYFGFRRLNILSQSSIYRDK